MNNLIGSIYYQIKLSMVDRKLTKNAEEMRDYLEENKADSEKLESFKYNSIHLEQLKLISRRTYLENKLNCPTIIRI